MAESQFNPKAADCSPLTNPWLSHIPNNVEDSTISSQSSPPGAADQPTPSVSGRNFEILEGLKDCTIVDMDDSSSHPSYSQEPFETLQSRYKKLEAKLDATNKTLEAAKNVAASACEEAATLRQEVGDLKADLAGSENYARDLRDKHKVLQKAHEDLQKQQACKTAESAEIVGRLEARISELEVGSSEQLTGLKSRILEHEVEAAKSEAKTNELELRVGELERDRDLKEPLFKIGVAIRLRNLELARALLFNIHSSKLNQELIKKGNAAAHHGMGSVDVSVFQQDIIPNVVKCNLGITFKELYKSEPLIYGSMSPKMLEAIDCEATIRTLVVVNSQRLVRVRQTALEHLDVINTKYGKLTKDAFEEDEDIDWRLARLKELTEEIVESDRQRHVARPRGSGSEY